MGYWTWDADPDPAIVRHLRALAARLVATPAAAPADGLAVALVPPDPAGGPAPASPSPQTEAAR